MTNHQCKLAIFFQAAFEGQGLRSVVTIQTPGSFGNELVGMCGNCDGVPNDLTTLDGEDVSKDPEKSVSFQNENA